MLNNLCPYNNIRNNQIATKFKFIIFKSKEKHFINQKLKAYYKSLRF